MYLTVFAAHCFGQSDPRRAFHGRLRGPRALTTTSPESTLCSLFLRTDAQSGEPPVAALTLLHDTGFRGSRWCLRADPVYLHPRRHELILISGFGDRFETSARLSETETTGLAAEIEEIVRAYDGELRCHATGRWYLLFDQQSRLITTPLGVALGQDIGRHLPRGPDAMHWRVFLNELQMRLHESEINENRQRADLYPVNSLWLWGGGKLPPAPAECPWTCVVCEDDELTLGLAATCGIETIPASRFDLDANGHEDRVLWVAGCGPHWTADLETLGAARLLAALRRGNIQRLTIIDPAMGSYQLAAHDLTTWGRISRFFSRPNTNENE